MALKAYILDSLVVLGLRVFCVAAPQPFPPRAIYGPGSRSAISPARVFPS
jgi:hypothetical protein